jgi:signal transduction histidine kinase
MKPRRTWVLFALCLGVVLAMMAWVSVTAIQANDRQREAEQRVVHEEQARLALWRMDSTLTPLLVREAGRDHRDYQHGSIALGTDEREAILYFRARPGGSVEIVQVSPGAGADAGEFQRRFSHARVLSALSSSAKPHEVTEPGARGVLLAERGSGGTNPGYVEPQGMEQAPVQNSKSASQRRLPEVQQQLNINEWDKRVDNYRNSISKYSARNDSLQGGSGSLGGQPSPAGDAAPEPSLRWSPGDSEMMRAVWVDGLLLLVRQVPGSATGEIEGCWLNWPQIEEELLANVEDLLEVPKLELVEPDQVRSGERLLATLPVLLDPGPPPERDSNGWTALQLSLVVAWVCVLLAAAAVFALLLASVSLSERRGAFVSAVTHELRTPLTTFRIYTEMLSEGMIEDEAKRQRYLETLRREADRLGVLVENVLAYAKIEGDLPQSRMQEVAASDLLAGVESRLRERAEQAEMELVVDLPDELGLIAMKVDPSAAEQILFNLVDNAAKYAPGATDRRIHLEVAAEPKSVVLRVRDHGSGIPVAERKKVFEPFSKSSKDESGHAPGVGLGLALSRGLARQMGGELRLAAREAEGGACFEVCFQRVNGTPRAAS